MKVYTKQYNHGHSASSIDGCLEGLFFSSNVQPWDGNPMPCPMYGDECFGLSSSCLFEIAPNLYFADVCCDSPKNIHHVKLVMTRPGSLSDVFCSQKLRVLEKFAENPECHLFLFFKHGQVYVTTKLIVSVLYTLNIDLNHCKRFQQQLDAFLWPVSNYNNSKNSKRIQNRPYNWNTGCVECNLE